jgi:hypothetical protein
MVEVRSRLRFVTEARDLRLRGEAPGEDDLQRDEPAEPDVARLVYDAHPALRQPLDQLVIREARPRRFGWRRRLAKRFDNLRLRVARHDRLVG